ncbi:M13 family metallopeptidase [Panacibacter microcysteis]|nr:M13 family metallopeptidase [Panacibacter microcysteis]
MKMRLPVLSLVSLAAVTGCADKQTNEKTTQKFVETAYMDSSVKPGDDFYMFVNGKWLKTATIPSTEFGVGSFIDLMNKTRDNLKTVIEEAGKGSAAAGSIEQKVGDFYASGMDSLTIEKLGYEPVKPALEQISGITNTQQLMNFVASQQKLMNNTLFSILIGADEKNSSVNILSFYQGGLGLPERDYYFKTDAETKKVVDAYKTYMQQLFKLTGDDSVTAAKNAANVFALETQLATSHKTNVELRDPESNYHKMAVAALHTQMPQFGWTNVLNEIGAKADSVNVGQPAFYAKVNELLRATSLETWKQYLRFNVLNDAANALSSNFVNAKFAYGKTLSGQEELKPRWQRITANTENNLRDALGQLYVKKYFTEDAKKRMLELVNNLQKALEVRIAKLDWMSDSTKTKAKEKLQTIIKKIGFPDKWRDYSNVTIDKNKYFENLQSCARNEFQYQVNKAGKPVDKTEWDLSTSEINAYYNPTFNEIVFPAGILQFPFFDLNADDAINYGGIGMVIGHEITHGFDDQGAQYDKDGNLRLWWSKDDYAKFQEKGKKEIALYNSFTVLDSLHVNGALTNGENIADLGGVNIAYDAFKMTKQGQDTAKIDGLTPDQRFFISVAQIWRLKFKDEFVRSQVNTDVHSPANWRVNGPLMNVEAFYKAFNVQPGEKMYRPDSARVKIW